MFKKGFAFILALILCFLVCACGEEEDSSKSSSKSPDKNSSTQTPIKTSDDLIGVWCMQMAWPEGEAKEFGEDLGIENFVTTAKLSMHVEFTADGKASYLKDLDSLLNSAKNSYFTIFSEAFAEAKKVLDEQTFIEKVEDSYGYDCYDSFLKNRIPDRHKNSSSHIKFFEMAREEMLKYENAPIEEKAAMGALWGEVLEEVGTNLVFKDNEWIATKDYSLTWTYDGNQLTFNENEYILKGTTAEFTLTPVNGGSSTTWTRVK